MTTPLPGPVPAPISVNSIDAALMRLPYEEWTVMPEASAHVQAAGLPRERLTTVLRVGRRRGILRTRREPDRALTYVMRVSRTPYPEAGPDPTDPLDNGPGPAFPLSAAPAGAGAARAKST